MKTSRFLASLLVASLALTPLTAAAQDEDQNCDAEDATPTEDDDCPGLIILPPGAGAGVAAGLGGLAPALGALVAVGAIAAASSGSGGGGGSAPQTNGF